ncbi:MAG TPA: SIR2 family protein [Bacteroidia bacterium]|nr:SIR2 family protein [Bacteroidia bacterium]
MKSQVDELQLRALLFNDTSRSYLYDKSKNNLDKLISLFKVDNCVSFIGAGASFPLNIPLWANLIKEIHDVAIKEGYVGALEKDESKYPEFVEALYNHFKGISIPTLYSDTVQKIIRAKSNSTTLTLVKVILALKMHVTTNLENSIEDAYEFLSYLSALYPDGKINKNCTSYGLENLTTHSPGSDSIYHVHGNANDKKFILRKGEYDAFYPSVSGMKTNTFDTVESFLKGIYKNKNIIFIGFSFQDKYVKDYFFKLSNLVLTEMQNLKALYDDSTASNMKEHFWLMDANPKLFKTYGDNIHDFFEKNKIFPILYNESEHIFIEKLFEFLSYKGI